MSPGCVSLQGTAPWPLHTAGALSCMLAFTAEDCRLTVSFSLHHLLGILRTHVVGIQGALNNASGMSITVPAPLSLQ